MNLLIGEEAANTAEPKEAHVGKVGVKYDT